jgi:hypothetical protein
VATVTVFAPGGYRYIAGVFQYSAGVAAERGFAIERARLSSPLPLADGFALVERHLAEVGRPNTAFCACELRSPAPFTEDGFTAFNRIYVQTLERWGIYRDGVNPVARTNVCPIFGKPAEPSLYAFSYTVPATSDRKSFIVAGSGETREGAPSYRQAIVRFGDVTAGGMREKVRFVLAVMEHRLDALGFGWNDAAAVNVYTAHNVGSLIGKEIASRGAAAFGATWHFARPPVVDIEYEMDVHGAVRDIII